MPRFEEEDSDSDDFSHFKRAKKPRNEEPSSKDDRSRNGVTNVRQDSNGTRRNCRTGVRIEPSREYPALNGKRINHSAINVNQKGTPEKIMSSGLVFRSDAAETMNALGFTSRTSKKLDGNDGNEVLENNNRHGVSPFAKSAPITDKSSSTEIMRLMDFDKSKGLGTLMTDREISAEKLEKLNSILEKAGIFVDDTSLDLEKNICVEENIMWIPPILPKPLTYEQLFKWRKIGPRLTTLRNEKKFIDARVLEELLVLKNSFNVFNNHEYMQVRARCNPFEKTGKGPFVSRAGLKIASLDAALSFALTQPTLNTSERQSFVGPSELFYFADICAGPGGFSEYVLFKKKWGAKGFGMTLKGKLDFDVGSFYMGCPESFEPFYGPANDGNVYNPKNVDAFIDFVMRSTEGRGVHLIMADGGFDVANKELQEPLSAQIYISQCLLALFLLRQGGMFVCKLFDTLTPFTVGLIYLMYYSFDLVAIHKPNTSRPANSERYLICKWKHSDTDDVMKYLRTCHDIYWEWTCAADAENAILELLPLSKLKENEMFYSYIMESNNRIARHQIDHMKRMVIFSCNAELEDKRQENIKKEYFEYLKVPEKSARNIIKLNGGGSGGSIPKYPDEAVKKLLGSSTSDEFLRCQEFGLTEQNLEAFIRTPFDWRIVVIEAAPNENNRGFYLSLGGGRVYRYSGNEWIHITEKLELCRETLVFGEFVDEIHGKAKSVQRVIRTFHIIDAMVLGGTDVRGMHYTSRHEVCVKFAKSMNKYSRGDLVPVRAKVPVRMENIADVFDRLENRVVSGYGPSSQLVCPVDHTDETLPFIKPIGILFLKITKDPWTMALSKTSNRKYYFNWKTGVSSYEVIPDSVSEFTYTMQNKIVWWWDKELKTVLSTQDVTNDKQPIVLNQTTSLNPHTLLRYVGGAWQMNKNMVMRRLSSSSNSQGSC